MAADALKECDLVMKGGVTSGIVYPPAILVLKEKYRFRQIGGASAGAIAAALCAAAELGRERGGFEKLKAVNDRLAGGTFLRDLFQPGPTTRPLFRALMLAFESVTSGDAAGKPRRKAIGGYVLMVCGILRRVLGGEYFTGTVAGLLVGLGLWFLHAFAAAAAIALPFTHRGFVAALQAEINRPGGWVVGALVAVLCALAGGPLLAGMKLIRIAKDEVQNLNYGLCPGVTVPGVPPGVDVLTEWIADRLEDLAARPPDAAPLTFGDLARAALPGGAEGSASVTLRMVTSNLSLNQPFRLPFEDLLFIFCEDEMRSLFPARVVDFMVARAKALAKEAWHPRITLPAGYHFMPFEDDMPVIVATRMSLSFPLLLSAVPVYTIRQSAVQDFELTKPVALGAQDLQRNWMSDGGISSNFPVHFFDAWLPSRPTFGINLTELHSDDFEPAAQPGRRKVRNEQLTALQVGPQAADRNRVRVEDSQVGDDVYLPAANELLLPTWKSIHNLFSFIAAIWSTAQNYKDTTQMMLPSYRERVVQVRFARDEGGLNLAMKPGTIEGIMLKGHDAGEKLTRFEFDHHRWVRMRVLLRELEKELPRLRDRLRQGDPTYYELLEKAGEASQVFRMEAGERASARARIESLEAALEQWREPFPFEPVTPTPQPALRPTPRL
jgi:predicted acylesterase/phospholipase RssA